MLYFLFIFSILFYFFQKKKRSNNFTSPHRTIHPSSQGHRFQVAFFVIVQLCYFVTIYNSFKTHLSLSVRPPVCLSVCLFELMYVYIPYCLFNKLLRFILSFFLLSLCLIVENGGRSVWDNLIGLPGSHYHYL